MFLLIKQKAPYRSTLFMVVYGKSNPSAEESIQQWNAYSADIQSARSKAPQSTDTIFMGDINARIGKADSDYGEEVIGKYGEPSSKRKTSGKAALEFLLDSHLTCLNAREPNETNTPPYTCIRKNGSSLIDIIAISSGMMKRGYNAVPQVDSLTGREDHRLVTTDIRYTRKDSKGHKKQPRVSWNPKALASERKAIAYREERDKGLDTFCQDQSLEEARTSNELAKAFTNIVHQSALRHTKKERRFHIYHQSRVEKREYKLREKMKRFRRRYKRELSDVKSVRSAQWKENSPGRTIPGTESE